MVATVALWSSTASQRPQTVTRRQRRIRPLLYAPVLPTPRLRCNAAESLPSDDAPTTEAPEEEKKTDSFGLTEMFEEVKDVDVLGSRGEGWAVSVVMVCALLAFPPVNLMGLIAAVGWILTTAGAVCFVSAVLGLGRNNFPFPYPRKNAELVNAGIYAHVRHPQYGGILMLCCGISAITRNESRGVFCLILWFLIERLIRFEERVMMERFSAYSLYRDQTRKLIPGMY